MKKVFGILLFLVLVPLYKVEAAPRYEYNADLKNNILFVKELNDKGEYEFTDHYFLISPGLVYGNKSVTPSGRYNMKPINDGQYTPDGSGEWYRFRRYKSLYVNYVTQFSGNYLIHSTAYSKPNYNAINKKNVEKLGDYASSGCIRMLPRSAAWIWHNSGGSKLNVYYGKKTEKIKEIKKNLMAEKPSIENWNSTVVTDKTKYYYTYKGDNLDKILEASGLTFDELKLLNPEIRLLSLVEKTPIGIAMNIDREELAELKKINEPKVIEKPSEEEISQS
ncbi:MAG: L,D-transpeptidase [Lachnospirales bacterium]